LDRVAKPKVASVKMLANNRGGLEVTRVDLEVTRVDLVNNRHREILLRSDNRTLDLVEVQAIPIHLVAAVLAHLAEQE
jgi:hypothetical protein